MTKEIKKYITSYVIYFKGEQEPIEISNEAGEKLKQDINQLSFINLNGNLYNKFEILKMEKRKSDYEIYELLEGLSEKEKQIIRKEIKLYKKEITPGVVKNMIELRLNK